MSSRIGVAAVVIFPVLGIVVPAIILGGSLLVYCYLLLFTHNTDVHGLIFGWLSHHYPHRHNGQAAGYSPSIRVAWYYAMLPLAFCLYVLGETIGLGVRRFVRAIRKSRVEELTGAYE